MIFWKNDLLKDIERILLTKDYDYSFGLDDSYKEVMTLTPKRSSISININSNKKIIVNYDGKKVNFYLKWPKIKKIVLEEFKNISEYRKNKYTKNELNYTKDFVKTKPSKRNTGHTGSIGLGESFSSRDSFVDYDVIDNSCSNNDNANKCDD